MRNIIVLCFISFCMFAIPVDTQDSSCKNNFNTQLCQLLKSYGYCTRTSARAMMYWLCSYTCEFCTSCDPECEYGNCVNGACICDAGYLGTSCSQSWCDVHSADCVINATASGTCGTGDVTCQCTVPWQGEFCNVKWCELHGASCADDSTCGDNDSKCKCQGEDQGMYCDKNWCDYAVTHTMCMYDDSIATKCGDELDSGGDVGVTDDDTKATIIERHRVHRKYVYDGEEVTIKDNHTILAASTIYASNTESDTLEWDGNLAKVAQRWMNQCIFEHDGIINRTSDPFYLVGQNVYMSESTYHRPLDWTNVIQQWYNEVDIVKELALDHSSFQVTDFVAGEVGHFTQLVWQKTTHIGCGYFDSKTTDSNNVDRYYLYVACNYGPGGNRYGHPIYV